MLKSDSDRQHTCGLFKIVCLLDAVTDFEESVKVVICGKYKNLNKITKIEHISLKFQRLLIFVILHNLQCKIEGHAV